MISLLEAQHLVTQILPKMASTELDIRDALDHVLAEGIVASEHIPPFDNTAMDGFAVQASDTYGSAPDNPVKLQILETIHAGKPAQGALVPGTAMRIMTGAPLPTGANAIVMVENTKAKGETVEIFESVSEGNFCRRKGDDIKPGDRVLDAGQLLEAGHLGVLATLGINKVNVVSKPKIGVLSTGDELVEGPAALQPGQIRDANRVSLMALIETSGFEVSDFGIVKDTEEEVANALTEASQSCDVLISSGGVSMGDADFVKKVLKENGQFHVLEVAIKPAKPLVFGVLSGTPCFCLPGNPVSSMVSFEHFARPALMKMMGKDNCERRTIWAKATESLTRPDDGKIHFQRVTISEQSPGDFEIRPCVGQGSHQLLSMARADGLAKVLAPPGISAGEMVEVVVLREDFAKP